MKKCDVIQDLMPLYCDDVASESSRAMVDEHIESCSECQELLENMKNNSLPDVTMVDEPEIGAFKTMKRKMTRKNIRVALISAACAIAVFCVVLFYQTPVPFEASNIDVSPTDDGTLAISSSGFDSLTGILIDDVFYFNVRATTFTRYISPVFRGNNVSHGRYSSYDIGGGALFFIDRFGRVTYRNDWTIPSGMDINADDVNRIYYLQGNLHRLASDSEAFERARENAILVWSR